MLKYIRLLLFLSLFIVSCDLSPDILCQRSETCKRENPSLGCFKGHCLPEWWIADTKKVIEKQHHCRYCPFEGDTCFDILRNDNHCGKCDEKCSNYRQCLDASCRCSSELKLCPDGCRYLKSSFSNCGKCGNKCKTNEYCSNGSCTTLACDKQKPKLETCGRSCVNLKKNPVHCGSCGHRCRVDQRCLEGVCRCGLNLKVCNKQCIDIQVDSKNCGACGKACSPGQVCSDGKCYASCPKSTQSICFGGCFDLKTSVRHCGKCGNRCQPGVHCIEGECSREIERKENIGLNDAGESFGEKSYPEQIVPECPNKEVEDCDGRDNDCNGLIDDLPSRSCYTGPKTSLEIGTCKAGTQACKGGVWGPCLGQILPQSELCDGKDNDCDGKVDGLQQDCYTGATGTRGVGLCKKGKSTCANGIYGPCLGEITPKNEVCDGKDNDCDGKIDDFSIDCYKGPKETEGKGPCQKGKSSCSVGVWSACQGQILPKNEVCDGKDNDCDGKIDDGCVKLISGKGGKFFKNGAANISQFSEPRGLAVDKSGNIFLADAFNHCIRKIDAKTGFTSTFSGMCTQFGSVDGDSKNARFAVPSALTFDLTGNLLVADSFNYAVRKIEIKTGKVTTIAGTLRKSGYKDSLAKSSLFSAILDLKHDKSGNLLILENNCVRKLDKLGKITTIAGSCLKKGHKDGAKMAALFDGAYSMVFDSSGNLYISEFTKHCIRKINTSGIVSTFVGKPNTSGYKDGTGANALFKNPFGLAIDSSDNLYIADRDNFLIRKITKLGVVSTLAGVQGKFGDTLGIGSSALLGGVTALYFKEGELLYSDYYNHKIKKYILKK